MLPKFEFVAEFLVETINSAVSKLEYFEKNREFVEYAVKKFSDWTEDFKIFKSLRRDEFEKLCEEDGVAPEIFEAWYSDWCAIRLKLEGKILRVIDYVLRNDFACKNLIELFEKYKQAVEKFFMSERLAIYQEISLNYSGDDLQEKLRVESRLYFHTLKLQNELLEMIFASEKF